MSTAVDYFHWHYAIAAFYLLIPPKRWFLKILYWPVLLPHMFLINMATFLEFAKLCLGGSGDFSDDVLNVGIACLHLMAVNRVARWLFIKKDYDLLIERIRRINSDFSIFNYVGPARGRSEENIGLVIDNPIEAYQIKKMQQSKVLSLKITFYFIFNVSLNLLVSYPISSLQLPVYDQWNATFNKTSSYRNFLYPLWYPFDTSMSDGYYWVGFVYEMYAFYFVMCSFFCVDCLCVNIMIYLTAQINVLGYALTCLDKNIDSRLDFEESLNLKRRRLILCINELQHIYKQVSVQNYFSCARALNDMFSSQLLIQMICMGTAMCCSVYKVTTLTMTLEMTTLAVMVAVCVAQVLTESWYSQEFTLELFGLVHHVYDLDWFEYPANLRNILLFLMKRLQTPFYFTMYYWLPLNVAVFLATIKFSYSFYTMITRLGS